MIKRYKTKIQVYNGISQDISDDTNLYQLLRLNSPDVDLNNKILYWSFDTFDDIGGSTVDVTDCGINVSGSTGDRFLVVTLDTYSRARDFTLAGAYIKVNSEYHWIESVTGLATSAIIYLESPLASTFTDVVMNFQRASTIVHRFTPNGYRSGNILTGAFVYKKKSGRFVIRNFTSHNFNIEPLIGLNRWTYPSATDCRSMLNINASHVQWDEYYAIANGQQYYAYISGTAYQLDAYRYFRRDNYYNVWLYYMPNWGVSSFNIRDTYFKSFNPNSIILNGYHIRETIADGFRTLCLNETLGGPIYSRTNNNLTRPVAADYIDINGKIVVGIARSSSPNIDSTNWHFYSENSLWLWTTGKDYTDQQIQKIYSWIKSSKRL